MKVRLVSRAFFATTAWWSCPMRQFRSSKSHGSAPLFPTFAFNNLPNTSSLRLKHSAPFVRQPLFARSCCLFQPRSRRLKQAGLRSDRAIDREGGTKGGSENKAAVELWSYMLLSTGRIRIKQTWQQQINFTDRTHIRTRGTMILFAAYY